MKMKPIFLVIALTAVTSLNCLGKEIKTKEEFHKYLKDEIYGYLDILNKKDENIKKDIVPFVDRVIDERDKLLKEHRNPDLAKYDELLRKHTTLINEHDNLTNVRNDLVKERDELVKKQNSPHPKSPLLLIAAVTLCFGLFLGRVSSRLASIARKLIARKPKSPKSPPPEKLNENPNKCPQCGTIRPEGQDKCPNPKCGIRF